MIYLRRGNDSLRKLAGIEKKAKYAPLLSFFDSQGNYKLATPLEEAYRAAVPNKFQNDFIELDRRVNLLYSALEGKVMRIFPIPNDQNNKKFQKGLKGQKFLKASKKKEVQKN